MTSKPITVELIPVFKDNYAYLLTAPNGDIGIIDPGEADPVIDVLEAKGLTLTHILNTHHHWDHVSGNDKLKTKYGAKLYAPAKEANQIGGVDIALKEGEPLPFGGENWQVIETPGHTLGHICLYAPESKLLFTGDTVFSMGCGRLFEGTPEQMWNSFTKLMALPDDTALYCGHEYTLANGVFAQKIEPDNEDIQRRREEVKALRRNKQPSLPSSIGLEKKTNIFLRAGSAKRFAEIRTIKDQE